MKIYIYLLCISISLTGCASGSYIFSSNPDGASVYFKDPETNKKFLMGATPLEYSKSALKQDKAFLVTFEKNGYFDTSVPIAPTDELRTTVKVNLKKNPNGLDDSSATINSIVDELFSAQKLIYQKRYKAAIIQLDQILDKKDWLTQAHVMKGTAYYLMNEIKSATSSWKKALQLDPNNKELMQFLTEKNINLE